MLHYMISAVLFRRSLTYTTAREFSSVDRNITQLNVGKVLSSGTPTSTFRNQTRRLSILFNVVFLFVPLLFPTYSRFMPAPLLPNFETRPGASIVLVCIAGISLTPPPYIGYKSGTVTE